MVEIAQQFGGGVAKLCGSGGAVVGSAKDEDQLEEIAVAFREGGFGWIRPDLSAWPNISDGA